MRRVKDVFRRLGAALRCAPMSACVIILTFCGAVGWMLQSTYTNDDIAISSFFYPIHESYKAVMGDPVSTAGEALISAYNHWMYVNGRLADILYILACPLPLWAQNVIAGSMVGALMMMILATTARGAWRRTSIAIIAAFLFWVMLAWDDQFNIRPYVYNYILTGLIMLWILVRMERGGTPISLRRGAETGLLMLLLTFMHELTALLTALWMGVYLLCATRCHLKKMGPGIWMIILLSAIGALLNLSPGQLERIAYETTPPPPYPLSYMYSRYFSLFWAIWIGAAVGSWAWGRGYLTARQALPYLAVMGVNMLFSIMLYSLEGRIIMIADICAVILILKTIYYRRCLCGRLYTSKSFTERTPIFITLMVLYAMWLGGLIKWEHRVGVTHEKQYIESMETPAKQGLLYADMVNPHDIPFWYLGIPRVGTYVPFSNMVLARRGNKREWIIVAPEKYKGKPFNQWDKVPGDNNLRYAGNAFVSDSDRGTHQLRITVGPGYISQSPIDYLLTLRRKSGFTMPDSTFTIHVNSRRCTGIDGKELYYVDPSWFMGRTVRNREILRVDTVVGSEIKNPEPFAPSLRDFYTLWAQK
ncbi:MAG: hypothetical protein K2M79_00895 [Muribaculaceae bacterium]|nr:hypothetical protein [Muribaculaceae bacterium]